MTTTAPIIDTDTAIVRWYAEHHCCGDQIVAARLVARWSVVEAHHWLRVASTQIGADGE